MKHEYDVIIVGGGPGGSGTALHLKDSGLKVALLDKESFPRDKVCGDGVSGKSSVILKQLGLFDKMLELPHGPGYGVWLSSPKGVDFIVDIRDRKGKDAKPNGAVVRRYDFDNFLFREASSLENVDAFEGYTVFDLIKEGDQVVGVKARDKDGNVHEFYGKIVVGADGMNSIVANKIGQFEKDPDHYVVAVRGYYDGVEGMKEVIEIHFVEEALPGYFWIFPLEGKKANVGMGMLLRDVQKHKANLKDIMDKIIKEHPKFKDRFKNAKLISEIKGWGLPLGSKRRKGYDNGVLLVGDAASLIDPFTGEGIGNALLSSKLAAQVIKEAFEKKDFSKETLQRYDELLKEHLDPELKTMYRLQRLGSIKFLLNLFFDKLQKKPELQELVISTIISDDTLEYKKKLSDPIFLIKNLIL
ncbi:MAG: geranylgeranyl reductase family protein [Candidatus Micrarchaeota archaeon]|nr:geranylgeranyl reductase family protein [Candidatus Micrarchaeota archaeon]